MYGNAKDYHELNAGVHRNNPKNLMSPALAWHIVLWTQSESSQEVGTNRSRDKLKDVIDLYFIDIYKSVKTLDPQAQIFPTVKRTDPDIQDVPAPYLPVILLFNNALHANTLEKIDEDRLSTRQKDVCRSNFRSIEIKFRWNENEMTMKCEFHTEFVTITTFAELSANVFAQFAKDKNDPDIRYSADPETHAMLRGMQDYLQNPENGLETIGQIRTYLFRTFWSKFENFLRGFELIAKHQQQYPLCEIVGDFRGIILSEKVALFKDEKNHEFDERLPLTWGDEAKKLLLPVLKLQKEFRARNYECTICYMLGGRALYMSALAPQLPEAPIEERIPGEYIVYAHQSVSRERVIVNKHQLGRLVSHIHMCGTLRLAAIKDAKVLHEVGHMLSHLDGVLQKARDEIAKAPDDAMLRIREAHERLNAITGHFLKATGSGVSYRIERSRYYVAQFRKNVEFLRIRRLEGAQPYIQFVEKRLGAEFDFIDRLGIRYERATNSMAALDQNYLAMNSSKIAERAIETDKRIATIQEWGEFALVAVLVPYYVTHLLEFFVKEPRMAAVSLVVWSLCMSLAFWRITPKGQEFDKRRRRRLATVAICAGLFVYWNTHGGASDNSWFKPLFSETPEAGKLPGRVNSASDPLEKAAASQLGRVYSADLACSCSRPAEGITTITAAPGNGVARGSIFPHA